MLCWLIANKHHVVGKHRQTLLRYFDESGGKPCGLCDTCLQPVKTWDASIAAQKAMSCVYRTGQRFGVRHLIDVLLGKQTARIKQLRHEKVSTYGIGGEYSANQWQSVYRQLIAQGLLEVDDYGSLHLHPSSKAVLRGEQKLHLRYDTITSSKEARKKPMRNNEGGALWQKLRLLRAELAKQADVPPYIIFHDKVLKTMCEVLPKDNQDLLAIDGIGSSKQQKYGQIFLNAIAEYISKTNTEMMTDTARESFELLQKGNTPEEIAVQRSVTVQTIYNHMEQAIQLNLIKVNQITQIPDSEIEKIEQAIRQHSKDNRLKPVFTALDERYDYYILRCVAAGMEE
ncbi:MAG: RQC domain-containing protein [Mariprofundales bacterium]